MNLADYEAAQSHVAFAILNDRGQLFAGGSERSEYLQGLLTNDIVSLQPGQGCYAAYLTPQGRMIADLRVFELGTRVLLDLPLAVTDTVRERLEQFIFTEDVTVMDASAALRGFTLAGPDAPEVAAAVLKDSDPRVDAVSLRALPEYSVMQATWHGSQVVVTRSDELRPHGCDLFVDAAVGTDVESSIISTGATRMSAATADTLRIEAGRPKWGAELREDVIPLEAGIEERAISFTKGCYVGQEVIIRVLHRGHGRVARRLVGLTVQGNHVPAAASSVLLEAREIGHVTSAALSPRFGAIALAYVHRDAAEPGTPVTVRGSAGEAAARVATLPFGAGNV